MTARTSIAAICLFEKKADPMAGFCRGYLRKRVRGCRQVSGAN